MDEGVSVKIVRSVVELEEIREAWNSWPGNRDSEIDSYLTFLRFNPATVRPHVIVIEREGKPDAIYVGRIDDSKVICRVGYWKLGLPAKIMAFVNGALRGCASTENCDLVVDSILNSLSAGEADAAYMTFLREDSRLFELAMTKPAILFRDHFRLGQHHFAAQLPATVDGFYQGLSPKVRKNQKWQAKKLAEQFSGDVVIRCFRGVTEIEELAIVAEQLASKSYQRGIGAGYFDTPVTRAQLRLKAERGWLRGYVLYLAGKPCAFWIGDVNSGTFGSDYLGYDPAYAKYSPGMYLIMKVVEGFCDGHRDGVRAIDFGPGPAQYKEVLSTEGWQEVSVHIFAATIKGFTLNFVRTLTSGVDQTLKTALARTKFLQKIKKAWRANATPETVEGT
jgi:hypothetical protein